MSKVRMGETHSVVLEKFREMCRNGIVDDNRIRYPVATVIGEGLFQYDCTGETLYQVRRLEIGLATDEQIDIFHSELEHDRVMISVKNTPLHQPSGNGWKNPTPKPMWIV